jgi:hypothetical protein
MPPVAPRPSDGLGTPLGVEYRAGLPLPVLLVTFYVKWHGPRWCQHTCCASSVPGERAKIGPQTDGVSILQVVYLLAADNSVVSLNCCDG